MTLSPGGISQACAISDKWYKVKLNSIDIVTDSYDNLITAQFRDVLRQKKTAEKMPSWYSEMKKNFYINMIDAS
jgi:hypothetical protein